MKRELKPFIALFLICTALILLILIMTDQFESKSDAGRSSEENIAYYQPLKALRETPVHDQVGLSSITTDQVEQVHQVRALQYEVAIFNNKLHELWHAEQAQKAAAARKAAAAINKPAPVVASNYVSGSSVWDRLAQCESGGNWSINTGNGYYGGLQFNLSTWQSYGGAGYPHQHSRETQIAVAERLRAARGFQPWPACSHKLGLR